MNDATETEPTTTAATRRTEPEIVAGILSAEGQPAEPDAVRPAGGFNLRPGHIAVAAALALGAVASMWARRSS